MLVSNVYHVTLKINRKKILILELKRQLADVAPLAHTQY